MRVEKKPKHLHIEFIVTSHNSVQMDSNQCQFPCFETIGLDTHALLIYLAAAFQALSRILNINSLLPGIFARYIFPSTTSSILVGADNQKKVALEGRPPATCRSGA